MKLSMWILADWLREYRPRLEITSGKLEIDTVRLFCGEMAPEKNILYVGRICDMFASEREDVVCIHQNDSIHISQADVNTVLNDILTAMEHYNRWMTALHNLISLDSMLEDFIDISAEVLPYPLVIMDSSQKVMAISKQHTADADSDWQDLLEHGSSNINKILQFNYRYHLLYQKTEIYSLPEGFWPNSGFACNLFLHHTWVGVMVMIEQERKITQGALDLFQLFSTVVQQWLLLHGQNRQQSELAHRITQAISGQTEELPALGRLLLLQGWEPEDEKVLLKLAGNAEHYNINQHLCHTLNASFPYFFAAAYGVSIAVLCNIAKYPLRQLLQELKPWLAKSHYYGAVSTPFSKLTFLPSQYAQADVISSYCEKENGQIYEISGYMLPYFASLIRQHATFPPVHPGIAALQEHDRNHNTDYLGTLSEYLRQERNQLATARSLHIHRSTLLYRLKRIEEMISVDLDHYQTRMVLLLSAENI